MTFKLMKKAKKEDEATKITSQTATNILKINCCLSVPIS